MSTTTNRDTLQYESTGVIMTGPEHTYTGEQLTQWAIDILSCTGAAVILRDQAEDPYCTRYNYISQHPFELDLVKIAKGTPILIIAPTREDWYQDVRLRHGDWQVM